MDMSIFQVRSDDLRPDKGRILMASPFLHDPNFIRSVILMIEHDDKGAMGVAVNGVFRPAVFLNDMMEGISTQERIPVFNGGPVGRDTLFFVHNFKDMPGAMPLTPELSLNGDFDNLVERINGGEKMRGRCRFYVGYSGWGEGQIESEIEECTWLVGVSRPGIILDHPVPDIWYESMKSMGGRYALWADYPLFPFLG